MADKPKLTARQQAFVQHYLLSLNASDAARKAGYSAKTANREGSRLLSNVDIQAAIETAKAQRRAKFQLDENELLQGLVRVAYFDPLKVVEFRDNQWVFRKDIAMGDLQGANFTIYPDYQSEKNKKRGVHPAKLTISSGDRKGAFELLGKHLGTWKGDNGSSGSEADSRARADVTARLLKYIRASSGDGGGEGSTGTGDSEGSK